MLKDKNKLLSIIFFALALSERIEFILLINIIATENRKFIFRNYFIVFATFIIVSPWFVTALLPNLKVIFKALFVTSNTIIEPSIFIFLYKYFLSLFLIILFIYGFIDNKKLKIFTLLLLFISITSLILSEKLPIRWFLPGLILFIFEISSYLQKNYLIIKNNNISKLILVTACFMLLFIFNNKNYISDHQILKKEIEKGESVIGVKLLIEKLNFNDYQDLFGNILKKDNIKNINFFKKKDAPLVFGMSGNIEIRSNRRYEYLAKYHPNNFSNKYIPGFSGLYWSPKKWCEILDKNVSIVIPDINKLNYVENLNKCDDFN